MTKYIIIIGKKVTWAFQFHQRQWQSEPYVHGFTKLCMYTFYFWENCIQNFPQKVNLINKIYFFLFVVGWYAKDLLDYISNTSTIPCFIIIHQIFTEIQAKKGRAHTDKVCRSHSLMIKQINLEHVQICNLDSDLAAVSYH